jgi:hypothetical protein
MWLEVNGSTHDEILPSPTYIPYDLAREYLKNIQANKQAILTQPPP